MLALLVSHRAKLWASTITHPCVCGRLGRRVLAPTLCDRHRASLHDPHSASSPPSTKKSRAMPVCGSGSGAGLSNRACSVGFASCETLGKHYHASLRLRSFGSLHLCIDSHLCRCICASTAICAVASVHRQPFVPLHLCNDSHLCRCIVQRLCVAVFMHPCITTLCGCLYASLHNDFVRPPSCILCTFMNALWALRPCKAFGRSFYKASVPYPQVACSPSRRTKNNTPLVERGIIFGADGGGRTRTVLLPTDFESVTSANSITSAY